MFIALANSLFHPIVIGVLIAAILSATMSTINAQIIICCSALSEDFTAVLFLQRAQNREMLFITRTFVFLVAVALLCLQVMKLQAC